VRTLARMPACRSCGAANPEHARFCSSCGAPLEATVGGEARKVVTVLFCDVVGSTALGERLDAETVRATMGRYFELARHAIESHGGTVEKFIGDAVMAVFGIPQLHEDDPVRAIRAALTLRDGLDRMNRDAASSGSTGIQARIGITTGEVVAGTSGSQTMVTGDPVNTAARIEQAAAPGTILIGELTERLARGQVVTTMADPIQAKGKTEPIRVFRVDGLVTDHPDGHEPTPLIGREAELTRIAEAVARAADARTVELVTVVAHAGVGKSRLIEAAVSRLPTGSRVLRGRCLPYGDGIATWPIREVFRAAAGIADATPNADIVARLAILAGADPSAAMIAAGTAQMMGVDGIGVSQDDGFWAVRRMLELLAEHAPLVVIFEDLHWADSTFLDLVEYVLDLSTGAPITIIATARPELLEARPGWGAGRSNAQQLRLGSLDDEGAAQLCRSLEGGDGLPDPVVTRIVDAAEGNPLFVEEMVASLRDDGILRLVGGTWSMPDAAISVPPTVKALLAARLDRLPEPTRAVVERGAVIGRIFETLALSQIAPEPLRASLTGHLVTLVRREFIRPARPDIGSGDAYAFRHVLIRDAAYDALPKRDRADLHERIADRLEELGGSELSQFQELVAHHLEQAHRYRVDLGETDERTRSLASRAAEHLTAIGDRSFEAGALARSLTMYRRALELAGDAPSAMLLLNAGDAMMRAADMKGVELLAAAVTVAAASGDDQVAALADSIDAMHQVGTRRVGVQQGVTRIRRAVATLERAGDQAALARAKGGLFFCLWGVGHVGETERVAFEVVEHWRAAGQQARAARSIAIATGTLVDGPTPVPEAIARCEAWMEEIGDSPNASRVIVETLGMLAMLDGRFDDARRQLGQSRAEADGLGQTFDSIAILASLAEVEAMAGNTADAEALIADLPEQLEAIDSFLAVPAAATLSRYRTRQGDAKAGLAALPDEPAAADDIFTRTTWYRAAALGELGIGRVEVATRHIGTAIAILEPTDLVILQADCLEIRAEVHASRGKRDAAREDLELAIAMYEAKGARAPLATARRRLELLAGG
jgi:class 3 adenylate cyclase/tetratricopeptide (TPR) repeat protein